MGSFEVSAEAQNDMSEIWRRIAADSIELADRIEEEFYESLGRTPGQGHSRKDLTARPVLFFPIYSFLVVYQPDMKPIRIMAVLRAKRNVRRILGERL